MLADPRSPRSSPSRLMIRVVWPSPCDPEPPSLLLLSGCHRLHRNSISVGCARNFGLLPSQLVEFVQRGFIRGIEGINLGNPLAHCRAETGCTPPPLPCDTRTTK